MKTRLGIALFSAATLAALVGFALAGPAEGRPAHAAKAKKTIVNGIGWHNSFPDALQEARQTGKPILLLSMFGRIDEDMPCANARTLRATLFKDPGFKKLVGDEVVPAWEMVRAVPKIEIDLGDGKKIHRTVRGNAVMYLCNSEGKVIDAYPGVYTAEDFLPMVRESIRELGKASLADVTAYHKARGGMPRRTAITTGKMMLESPTLNLIGAPPIAGAATAETTPDPARALFLRAARQLSDASLTPMAAGEIVPLLTGAPLGDRDPKEVAAQIMKNDSRANMERTRPVIHLWLASEKELPTPAAARDTVLETILKIPYKDPYFGLKDVLLPGTPN